jgi:hypothetical protein
LLRHVRFPEPFSKRAEAPRNMRTVLGQCGENSTRVPDAARALGGANGSRECAPDDRLRIVRRGRSGLGPGNVVSAYSSSSPPAIARLGSDFSGLRIVMGCPWHDIRIVTDAGGHWRNISSELPASVSKWAKSYNSSRSLPPTGQPVSFKRPARYTRAYSRRRPPVSRQSKMTILRPDFLSRKPFLQS